MKKRYWIALIVATLLAAVVVTLPIFIERYAEKWLTEQGVPNASIGDIDLNLFSGTLQIESIDFSGTAEERGQVDLIALNAEWSQLFKRQILLADIALAGVQLDVVQLDDGRYRLGGLTIPPATEQAEPEVPETESAESTGSPWGFGLERLSIDNVDVSYKDKRLHSRVAIDQLTLDRLATWEAERRSEIAAKLKLDGAAITLSSAVAPLAASPSATSSLKIEALHLLPYASIFNEMGLSDIAGAVSIDITNNTKRDESGEIALDVSGSAALENFAATLPQARVSNQRLTWSGDIAATISGAGAAPQVSGKMNIAANTFALAHPEQPLSLAKFGKLAIDDTVIKGLDSIQIGRVAIKDLSTLSSADATTLTIANTQINAVNLSEQSKLSIARLSLDGMLGVVERNAAGDLEPTNSILAAFTPPSSSNAPAASAEGDVEQTAAPIESASSSTSTTESPFTFNIGVVEIGGKSQVHVSDLKVSPPIKTTLNINTFTLSDVRNDDPTKPMHVVFDIQQDNGAKLSGKGNIWPFGEQPASEMDVAIHHFDLSQISSYVPGYHIERGRFSLNTHAALREDKLDITNEMIVEKLKLSGKAAGEQKMLGEGMAMPLDVALDLLRDRDDRIKLELPVSGSLSDPKFEAASVFQMIIQNALQKAAVSFVKNSLQPLGTIMLVTKIAGKAARPRFEPIAFAPGDTELNKDSRAYLDKIAKLLLERPGLSITFCGVSTQADRDYLAAQASPPSSLQPDAVPEEAPPEQAAEVPDFSAERIQLAASRGDTIQNYLAKGGEIKSDRLFRCRPTLEADANQPPRVEVTL